MSMIVDPGTLEIVEIEVSCRDCGWEGDLEMAVYAGEAVGDCDECFVEIRVEY